VAAFFGYANFVLAGYFKDVSADRATGYNTLPVLFGWRAVSRVSDVFALLALVGAVAAVAGTLRGGPLAGQQWMALALLGAGAFASALAQFNLHGVVTESEAHRAISPVVHAYILLLAAVAVAHQPNWVIPLVLFYAGFLWILKRRPLKEQI
jgi:4-hydroxybenzoate polyprenyltransferase